MTSDTRTPCAACNEIDDNCNGLTDDGLPTAAYYIDSDSDGYGTGAGVVQCGPLGGHTVTSPGDCDDGNANINPGRPEVCNGIDDNCGGGVDEGLVTASYFKDLDLDGYGGGAGVTQCGPLNGFTLTVGGDCNDADVAIHPGASEICNGLDDNCNGSIDEGLPTQTYYADVDGDLYGNPASSVTACNQPAGYVANNYDCNDTVKTISPAAPEICGNSIDDNCNGQIDEGCVPCVPTVIQNFDTDASSVAGWTLDNRWKWYAPSFDNSKGALEYTDAASGSGTHGYYVDYLSTHYLATTTLHIPKGTKKVTMAIAFQNKGKLFGFSNTDTSAKLDLTLTGADTPLVSISGSPTYLTASWTFSTPPPNDVDLLFTADFSAGSITESSNSAGFFGIDNIQGVCQ